KKNARTMCAAWRKNTDSQTSDAVMVACSNANDTGATYDSPMVVAPICPVDWGTTTTRFRTKTTPTITADDQRFYMAWAERPRQANGTCDTTSTTSRIKVSTSPDGKKWTTPTSVDSYGGPGFQLFPQMTFNGKFVNLVWFD